jgi:Glycosyltransferase
VEKLMVMPKLLQINVTANWGSTGKIAEQIGLMAMAHGWESYIAYGRMMNPSKSNLIKIGGKWDVYRHYAGGRFFDREGLGSQKPTLEFLKVVDEIKPDIVHLHNIHDHYMNYPLLFEYLAEKKIPVVWTQHDQWATTGHCAYNLVGCEKWKTECEKCPMIGSRLGGIRFPGIDRSKKNFQLKKELCAQIPSLTIVPVSHWLENNIKQSHLKDRRIEVIHNGIDLNVFKPQEADVRKCYGIGEKDIVLGVAAVWDERKGLKDFISLSQLLPPEKFVIVIVGKVNEPSGISNEGCEVIYIERTQNALELAQLYTAASVFVNPTYQDNYPTTNLEAMACGTPVVTYRTGGSPEAVSPETGWVVAQGDVAGLAVAIEDSFTKDRVSMSKACRTRAEHEFDKDKCFEKYLTLYESLQIQ